MHKFARIIELPDGNQVLLQEGENSNFENGLLITTAIESKMSGEQHNAQMHLAWDHDLTAKEFASRLEDVTVEHAVRMRAKIVESFSGMF